MPRIPYFLYTLLRPRTAALAGAMMVAALAACDDDPHGPEKLPPVASVQLSESEAELPVGGNRQLSAVLKAADGRVLQDRAITWSSSDSLVAKVTGSGRVTAVAEGAATITALSEGKRDSARVTIFVPNAEPIVVGLAPAEVTAGSPAFMLTVNGTGFVLGSQVRWNDIERPTAYVSSTELRVEIPATDVAAVGSIAVKVSNPAPGGGLSNARSFEVVPATEPNPVPVLAGLNPSIIVAGSSARPLSLGGSGFIPASKVLVNGVERPTTYYNPGLLHVALTAADLERARDVQISVYNAPPGGGSSEIRILQVTATAPNPVPVIQELTPGFAIARRSGFVLVVRGRDFVPGSKVQWRGAERPTAYISSTELRAEISAADIVSAGSADISVHNPTPGGGTSQPANLPIHSFSNSGKDELIFAGTLADGRSALFSAVPSLVTYPTRLPLNMEALDPTPSPDGTRIAFVGLSPGGDRDIYVVNRDGSGLRQLTSSEGYDDQPAWSPDGTKIAFRSYRAERLGDIWVMNADGSNPVNLTPATGTAVVDSEGPAWSPDGTRIAYARGHNADRHIWTMRASDGGDKRQVTNTTGRDTEPAWSPDGRVIAFSRTWAGGSERIHFVTPEGGAVSFLFAGWVEGRAPAWSPNGEWIAHSVRRGGQHPRYELMATMLNAPATLSISGVESGGPGGRNATWISRP